MEKDKKTNAMRILERAKVPYQTHHYQPEDGHIDGVSVAEQLGEPLEKVYKTLVTQGASREYYVFVIPVAAELDRKAAAKAVGEKAVELIRVDELNRVTGYIRGGCSPVGMKKAYCTVLDVSCEGLDSILVSGGKIGVQVELSPQSLLSVTHARTAPITVK